MQTFAVFWIVYERYSRQSKHFSCLFPSPGEPWRFQIRKHASQHLHRKWFNSLMHQLRTAFSARIVTGGAKCKTWSLDTRVRSTNYGVQILGCEVQIIESRYSGAKYKLWSPDTRVRSANHEVQIIGREVQIMESRYSDAKCKLWCLNTRVRSANHGV